MNDYDKPKVPPATPPTIDPNVDPVEARELTDENGDNLADGSKKATTREEGEEAREKLKEIHDRDRQDGKGERELDSLSPETLLPPD